MRYITKSKQGCSRLKLKNSLPPKTSQEASRKWKGFKTKSGLLQLLLDEQLNVCCYSELRADDYGYGYHIEHVLNKSEFPELTFEYTNLAASALSSSDLALINGICSRVAFGGHAIGKSCSVDKDLLITPYQPGCENFFYYLSSGEVAPAIGLSPYDLIRANYTIKCLNLNSQFLVRERKSWWDELNDVLIDNLSDQEAMKKLAELYIGSASGALKSFYSMSFQMFGRTTKRVK